MIEIDSVIWKVSRNYFYSMDIVANEFYPRPDINKILKKYYNLKGFKYLGKPLDIDIKIGDYKIEF